MVFLYDERKRSSYGTPLLFLNGDRYRANFYKCLKLLRKARRNAQTGVAACGSPQRQHICQNCEPVHRYSRHHALQTLLGDRGTVRAAWRLIRVRAGAIHVANWCETSRKGHVLAFPSIRRPSRGAHGAFVAGNTFC